MTTFAALDFETADHGRDSARSVGFIHSHGMRWQDVADQPTFGEWWAAIQPLLQGAVFLAAHKAAFDKGLLYACCDLYGMTPKRLPGSAFNRSTDTKVPAGLENLIRFESWHREHSKS